MADSLLWQKPQSKQICALETKSPRLGRSNQNELQESHSSIIPISSKLSRAGKHGHWEHGYEGKLAHLAAVGNPGRRLKWADASGTGKQVFSPVNSCVGLRSQVCYVHSNSVPHLSFIRSYQNASCRLSLWQLSQIKLGVICQEPPLSGFPSTI